MDAWIGHASFGLIFFGLLLGGLGLPIPEDPLLLAAGVIAHQRDLPLPWMVLACALAVLGADFLLFSLARRFGDAALERPIFRRLLPPTRRASLETMFKRRGDAVVFVARHLPGLRAPVFALAGIHGMRRLRFLLWDAIGLSITAPIVVSLGWFGSAHIDLVRARMARVEHWVVGGVVVALSIGWMVVVLRRRKGIDTAD